MAKKKTKLVEDKQVEATVKYPSRAGYKGTYLPKSLYNTLHSMAKKQERSVAFLVRRAVEEYIQKRKESADDDD